MDTSALLLAYSAGLVAAVNPCGFALLPAYLTLLVVGEDRGDRARLVGRAVTTSAVMTLGFVSVFLAFGLLVSPFASSAQRHLPWVTLVLGLGLAGAGLWVLTGRTLPGVGWRPRGTRVRRGLVPVLIYGIGYAAASLTCTAAPFLAVVIASFRVGSTIEGLALFLAYGVGMGTLVTAVAVAVAVARDGLVRGLRRGGRHVGRVAGLLLVVVGVYVAWYGAWELRVLAGGGGGDPVVRSALDLQSRIADVVDRVGPWWLVVPALAVAAFAVRSRLRTRV